MLMQLINNIDVILEEEIRIFGPFSVARYATLLSVSTKGTRYPRTLRPILFPMGFRMHYILSELQI
jgi:hypothetical protein